MNKSDKMGTKKILPLLVEFSIPAIIGMLVNAIYNIVDRMFIGNAPELGSRNKFPKIMKINPKIIVRVNPFPIYIPASSFLPCPKAMEKRVAPPIPIIKEIAIKTSVTG